MTDPSAASTLQAENVRLIALLEAHGIEWRLPQPAVLVTREPDPSRLSTAEKVALLRRLFRGRADIYPVRWEGKTSGKSGYAPACANERRAGVSVHQPSGIRHRELGHSDDIELLEVVMPADFKTEPIDAVQP
jgi:hypothetical protein